MKRGIAIVILFALIVGFASLESILVTHAFDQLGEKYKSLQSVIEECGEETSTPNCLEQVENATEFWNQKKKLFSIYIPHNSLVELNLKATRLLATVRNDDKTMALIELDDIIQTFPEYHTRYMPTLHNIL